MDTQHLELVVFLTVYFLTMLYVALPLTVLVVCGPAYAIARAVRWVDERRN